MRVLVLGGAVSGRAAARLAQRSGHAVCVYDRDPEAAPPLLADGIAVVVGSWSGDLLAGVDLVVTSPGILERAVPIVDTLEAGIPLVSEVEFAARHLRAPLVAVTGTNGKTTVSELIGSMLEEGGAKALVAGNIGTALSEVAEQTMDVAVVEVSSFQLRFTEELHPAVAVLLNIAPDHLDWHGSLEAYAAAKANVFRNQTADDVLVYDADDAGATAAVAAARARLVAVSGSSLPPGGAGVEGEALRIGNAAVPLSDLGVDDPSYLVDLAAAGAAALEAGAPPDAVERVARAFRPGAHRRSLVGEWDGVRWIDDSKATNPHAARAAMQAFPSVVLIAGGRNKGLDLSPLMEAPSLRHVVAIGEAAPELASAGPGRVTVASSMPEAVREADARARPGDVVLLAPGCASFDMYRSYGERGDAFAAAVQELKGDP